MFLALPLPDKLILVELLYDGILELDTWDELGLYDFDELKVPYWCG